MKINLFVIYIILGTYGCSPKIKPYIGEQKFNSETGIPDYGKLEYWAAHPGKWDPSDSIAGGLDDVLELKKVDVFFLHPTTFTDADSGTVMNASIDDPYLNKKTDYSSILYQASVFNSACQIYAPRYRQAHIQMYYEKDSLKSKKAFDIAYQDVKTAFQYYLRYYNKGNPIIIASHSQGTTHAKKLLKDFFDSSSLKNKLVAAYIIGIPVERKYFSELYECKDSISTGCIISWRTFREGYEGNFNSKVDNEIIVTNPVSWKTDNSLIDKQLHHGAVLYKFEKIFKHTHSTRIVGNMLWVSKPKFPGSIFYKTSNYHAGDINLFYIDMRNNVNTRIASYYKQNKTL
jgi:hypothetical protein